jgi:uncharacterized protein (DUF1330 family)
VVWCADRTANRSSADAISLQYRAAAVFPKRRIVMAAYLVATVRISDATRFAEYGKAIAGLSERFGGEYVVRGKVAEVLEGGTDPDERVVVSRFPDAAAARAYVASPEYQAGAALREGAAVVEMRLLVD